MTPAPGTVLSDGSIQGEAPGTRWKSGVVVIPVEQLEAARQHGWEKLGEVFVGLVRVRRK